jgi:hypothetical protein
MAAAFEEAARRRPAELVVSSIMTAGGPVRLRIVGRDLARHLAAALGHLAAPEQPAALRVDLWDEAVTAVPCPLPSDPVAFPRDVNGTLVRLDPVDPQRMWTSGAGAVTELDGARGRLIGWRANASELSVDERGRPFPVALQAWLQSRAVVTLHAAGVACAGRAALIVGDSGSGKSTTALICATAGFGFLGDDQIAVSWAGQSPVAHSLFASARVDRIVGRVWRGAPDAVYQPPAGKALVMLSEPATRVVPAAGLTAVIVASVGSEQRSTLERATAKEALRATVPSTMLGVAADRPAVLRACARAVLGRPTFRLRLGRDLDAVPGLVARALAESR